MKSAKSQPVDAYVSTITHGIVIGAMLFLSAKRPKKVALILSDKQTILLLNNISRAILATEALQPHANAYQQNSADFFGRPNDENRHHPSAH